MRFMPATRKINRKRLFCLRGRGACQNHDGPEAGGHDEKTSDCDRLFGGRRGIFRVDVGTHVGEASKKGG